MSKKSNKNKKQPKVSSIVGVPFIYDQAQMERVEKDVVDNYGGDVFKAFLQHPYVDIHTDKQGIYVGEKRGQYPFKKVYDNLYAYLFWTKNSQLVNDVAHQMVEKKPSMIKRYPELIRWARAQVLNMVANQYGMQPICNIPEPQTERIDDATTIIERYGGRVSDELSTIAIELSKAGAPDTVIYDIVSNTCDKIDAVIAQQKETIGNYIEQNNLISEEVEDTFTHAQEHHHDCHCAHCEERSTATNQAAYTREEAKMEKKLKFATIRFVNVNGEAKVEYCEKEFVDGSKEVIDVNKEAEARNNATVNQTQQSTNVEAVQQIIPQEINEAAFTAPEEPTVTCGDFDDFNILVQKESDIMAAMDDDTPVGIPMPMGNPAPHPNMVSQYPQYPQQMLYNVGFNYGDPSSVGFPYMSAPYGRAPMVQNIPMYRGSGNF